MNKFICFILFITLNSCGFYEGGQNNSLVSVDVVSEKLRNREDVQIIDVRTEDEFLHGHIPSARNIWRNELVDTKSPIDGMRLPEKELETLLGQMGLNDKDSIFLYDASGNVDASRLWWLFKLYGFENVALIDGGFIQWRLKGYPVSETRVVYDQSVFTLPGKNNLTLVAEKSDIINSKFEQIIDARSSEEYNGDIMKNGAVRGGHIPGAVQFDYVEMLDGGSFKLKSTEEILALMKQKGLSPEKNTVIYCHSGVRSSMVLFALREILGMENVSNYDGSWIEWSQDESQAVETGNDNHESL